MSNRFPFLQPELISRVAYVFVLALLCQPGVAFAGVPLPENADEAALKEIDKVRQLEPNLPRPDNVPIALGPGSLALPRAVEIAIANNVDMQTKREKVRDVALSLVAVRRGYYPQWHALITGATGEQGRTVDRIRTNIPRDGSTQAIGLTQVLPFGGSMSLDFGGTFNKTDQNIESTYAPLARVSLTQPLLRGAGHDLQQEPLTIAKRALLDSLRTYRMQREDFAINVIGNFLGMQVLRAKCQNLQVKRDATDLLARKEQVFYELGRETELEVLRATQESLLVQQDLLNYDLDLRNRMELFAITLNFPTDATLELAEFLMPYQKLQIGRDEAVRTALKNRLDLQAAEDDVEDSARRLKFAHRNLLPNLDVTVSADMGNTNMHAGDGVIQDNFSAGFSLSLPLERTRERLDLYFAWQAVQQDQRELDYARSFVTQAIHGSVNNIKRLESLMDIQDLIIRSGNKRSAAAQFLLERGKASSREVIDANTIRIDAMNRKLDILLEHYLAMLRLKRDMGILNLDELSTASTAKL